MKYVHLMGILYVTCTLKMRLNLTVQDYNVQVTLQNNIL